MAQFKIKNKDARSKVNVKAKKERSKAKRKQRKERQEQGLPKLVPKTIDSMRVFDETRESKHKELVFDSDEGLISGPENEESSGEESDSESEAETADFFQYFHEGVDPKILITTSANSSKHAYNFVDCFGELFEDIKFVKRKRNYSMKDMAKLSSNRGYTHLIVVNEDKKSINGITFMGLPEGPTFYFSVSSYKEGRQIYGHGKSTSHIPELVVNNLTTSLGQSVASLFKSLFPHKPDIEGRQVITIHNQRDFIFFRRHRYVFKENQRVGLQELGPQFTLRLRRVQRGIKGEIEWEHKPGMDKEKKRFYL